MGYKAPNYYTLCFGCSVSSNPLDSTVYYCGDGVGIGTVVGSRKLYIPQKGTIVGAYLWVNSSTQTPTTEDVVHVIRKNDTTDYTFKTQNWGTANPAYVSNYALSIPVVAGDYIAIKFTTPAWVTNPTGVYITGAIVVCYG